MTDHIYTIDEIKKIIIPIAQQYKGLKIYLFGSYARGEADEKSDIDFRIDGGKIDSLFILGGLYAALEEALQKPLDLITTASLRQNKEDRMTQKLIRHIRKEERLIYEDAAS